MIQSEEVCKNCAYAAARADLKRFGWCKYICTLPAEVTGRRIAYRYEHDTCKHFMPTNRPVN